MADDIQISQTQTDTNTQQGGVPAEVAKLMELSLNGPQQTQQAAVTDIQQQAAVQTDAQTAVTDTTPAFSFDILKEKFGYEAPDQVLKEIEELRAFRAAPPPKEELKFENPESENLFKAIQKGDRKAITQILSQQDRIESLTTSDVTEATAADIIKFGMRLKHRDLSDTEIEYKFNKQFAIPKEPVQELTEDDATFSNRKSDWENLVRDIKMEMIIEAKVAKPDLELAKSKLVLPQSGEDEGYTQYRKMLEERPSTIQETVDAYKTFTPKSIEVKVPFTDEANKIAFEFQYEPDGESFNKSVSMVSDMDVLSQHFSNQDGTPDRKRFLEALHFGMNKEKIILEAMKQAKNATLKAQLPDNTQGGLQRQFPQQQQQLSELDKQMKLSLNGYQPA
jgi:hypothetical protein